LVLVPVPFGFFSTTNNPLDHTTFEQMLELVETCLALVSLLVREHLEAALTEGRLKVRSLILKAHLGPIDSIRFTLRLNGLGKRARPPLGARAPLRLTKP
jgi:hypothetical protein